MHKSGRWQWPCCKEVAVAAIKDAAGVVALRKTLLGNIGEILNTAERDGKQACVNARGLPDKIEGYSWGPRLPNGDHLLLACNDNDFDTPETGFPNHVFAFSVPDILLPAVTVNRLNAGVRFGPR